MAYKNGVWNFEDDSVATKTAGLLSKDNPLMKAARASSMKQASRRGLQNSTMAAQAGTASMLGVATPIASQDASQTAQKNLQRMGINSSEKVAAMNIASHDREKTMSALAAMASVYDEGFSRIASNNNLPADARNKYTEHLGRLRDSNFRLVEQMYGVDLDWGSTGSPVVSK